MTWYEDNKENHLSNVRKYYDEHKEEIKAKKREWYYANKERLNNKSNEYIRNRTVNNSGKMMVCSCGAEFNILNKSRHSKTKRHLKYLEDQNQAN